MDIDYIIWGVVIGVLVIGYTVWWVVIRILSKK